MIPKDYFDSSNMPDRYKEMAYRYNQFIESASTIGAYGRMIQRSPADIAGIVYDAALNNQHSTGSYLIGMTPAQIVAAGYDAVKGHLSSGGVQRAFEIESATDAFAVKHLIPLLQNRSNGAMNLNNDHTPQGIVASMILDDANLRSAAKMGGFASLANMLLPGGGIGVAAADFSTRMDVADTLYGLGLVGAGGRAQLLDTIYQQGQRIPYENALGAAALLAGGPAGRVLLGGVLASHADEAEAGYGRLSDAMRGMAREIRGIALSKSATIGELRIATEWGRILSRGGTTEGIQAAGLPAESLARALAENQSYRVFPQTQRGNGTGFDFVYARDTNGKLEVFIPDVKNTLGEINSVTAFGAGAKTGAANFNRNLETAIERISADRNDLFGRRVAEALRNGQYELQVISSQSARLNSNVTTDVLKYTGKTPTLVKWF